MTRRLALVGIAGILALGAGMLVAVAFGRDSLAIGLLGLLVIGLFAAIFEVGRRLRESHREATLSRRSLGLLARSATRSLRRSQRIERAIQGLVREQSRHAEVDRRVIAAVESERLAAERRQQASVARIQELGARQQTALSKIEDLGVQQEAAAAQIELLRGRLPAPRRGHDLFHDFEVYLPILEIETIFDVGAHVGESAAAFRSRFPRAQIYSFEPIEKSFGQLEAAVAGDTLTRAFQIGLSDHDGTGTMAFEESESADAFVLPDGDGEMVQLRRLDSFCQEQGVTHIDFLKIDTEGHDLKVLQGAKGMLSREMIGVIQVEAGLNPENVRHVPLEALKAELEEHGYRLFGLYEQVGEWPTDSPQLRRINAVFAARNLISKTPAVPSGL